MSWLNVCKIKAHYFSTELWSCFDSFRKLHRNLTSTRNSQYLVLQDAKILINNPFIGLVYLGTKPCFSHSLPCPYLLIKISRTRIICSFLHPLFKLFANFHRLKFHKPEISLYFFICYFGNFPICTDWNSSNQKFSYMSSSVIPVIFRFVLTEIPWTRNFIILLYLLFEWFSLKGTLFFAWEVQFEWGTIDVSKVRLYLSFVWRLCVGWLYISWKTVFLYEQSTLFFTISLVVNIKF